MTVKAPALDDALDRIAGAAGAVLPLLNGIEHMETLRERFPGSARRRGEHRPHRGLARTAGIVVQPTPSVGR